MKPDKTGRKKSSEKKSVPDHPKAAAARSPAAIAPTQPPSADGPAPDSSAPSADSSAPDTKARSDFPIVGIGASAGGLAAFEAFFSAMPADAKSGMAFVLVQHLAPDHKSILAELIQRYTHMKVVEVEDGMEVMPDCAYTIPPNRDMALLNGALHLLEPTEHRGVRLSIDHFFRSLAQDQRERAVCVVLSGTGSDGTLGAREVKGAGGMVMAQSIETTEFDSMPKSVITAGLADFVLPPAEMPAAIAAYMARMRPGGISMASSQRIVPDIAIKKICVLLRTQTGHDFSQYKENTLMRRIERRMAVQKIEHPTDYLRFMQETPAEADALFRDLLIGVTNFFRDAEVFATFEREAIPRLLAGKREGATIRVWVCGCSTGEEAYSIAILLQEQMDKLKQVCKVQIFATDVDKQAVDRARSGVYPSSIEADVSPERLERFFSKEPGGSSYRIQKVIRDLVIFSEHDVIKDPPFSRLNLLSCRNLLIYMNADLQKKIIPFFHYALRPEGLLVLGTSENVGEFPTLFTAIDIKAKIFLRRSDVPGTIRPLLGGFSPRLADPVVPARLHRAEVRDTGNSGKADLRELTERLLLRQSAQVAILVNDSGEILHIHGRTGRYLEPAPGNAEMNILAMARKGLHRELATALHQAVARKETIHRRGLSVETDGDFLAAHLSVIPATADGDAADSPDLFLVVLEEAFPESASPAKKSATVDPTDDVAARIAPLEQELRARDEYLQATIEQMDTSQEELKSTNEEMQSVNEELQSANEELETSREEMQSVNEELATVNSELQTKVADLSRANNDMNNLLAGTGDGTLFVDHEFRISRFTPATTQIINLIPSDVGRPVGHIAANLKGYDHLVEDVKKVLDTLIPVEFEVETTEGAWYLMRIRPYRTLENVIEGAVINFVNITERKKMEKELQESAQRETSLREEQKLFFESIVTTVREPLVVLDCAMRVVSANRAFFQTFHVDPKKTVGNLLFELGNRQWDIPELRRLIEEVLPRDSSFEDFEVTHEFEDIGHRRMLLNARRIIGDADEAKYILLSIEDVTDHVERTGKESTS